MPYSAGDLRKEIKDIVADNLAAGISVHRGWLVHHVLSQHPLPEMNDEEKDFNVLCRQAAVVEAARGVLRELKLGADDPEHVSRQGELPLAGYKHLQVGYPIERDGELVFVPLVSMSGQERRNRAEQYYAMARGCASHADELIRYDDDATSPGVAA